MGCLYAGCLPLVKCEALKKQSVDGRCHMVKRFGLRFRCLADNHHGKPCPRSKPCGMTSKTDGIFRPEFRSQGSRKGIELTYFLEQTIDVFEVTRAPNEPIARLCPLGWTAIEKIQLDTKGSIIHFVYKSNRKERAYFHSTREGQHGGKLLDENFPRPGEYWN